MVHLLPLQRVDKWQTFDWWIVFCFVFKSCFLVTTSETNAMVRQEPVVVTWWNAATDIELRIKTTIKKAFRKTHRDTIVDISPKKGWYCVFMSQCSSKLDLKKLKAIPFPFQLVNILGHLCLISYLFGTAVKVGNRTWTNLLQGQFCFAFLFPLETLIEMAHQNVSIKMSRGNWMKP